MQTATIAAFTGPYIYINNQEQIDAQINHYSDIANSKLLEARGYSEQYAGEAVSRAKATATQLTEKVQNYTNRKASASHGNLAQSDINPADFPRAPAQQPLSPPEYQEHHTEIPAA